MFLTDTVIRKMTKDWFCVRLMTDKLWCHDLR